MKIAIIGGGYTGLSAAKSLIKDGNEIIIFEKGQNVGGMVATFDAYGTNLEYFYRHIFKSDKYVVNLVNELGLTDKLKWIKTIMGYYTDENMYEFGTPISLLKFKPLKMIDKLRFGISILKLKFIKDYANIENILAYEWLIKNAGKTAYEKVWEPLLISKFGDKYKEISMAWMWGKIILRNSSGKSDGEKLGYIEGSYQVLTDAFEQYLLNNNVKIEKDIEVGKVVKDNQKYTIETSKGKFDNFDIVISTVAFPLTLNIANDVLNTNEKDTLSKVQYTAARVMVLFLNKQCSKYYWLNNGDKSMPFGGLIEHTNFIDKSEYKNNNVLYISNYMFENDRLYNISDEQLLEEYLPMLKKVYKDFEKENIVDYKVYKERYAQPVIVKNYSQMLSNLEMESKGLYIASMPQIYPEDRGLNYAIELGQKVANCIKDKFEI